MFYLREVYLRTIEEHVTMRMFHREVAGWKSSSKVSGHCLFSLVYISGLQSAKMTLL